MRKVFYYQKKLSKILLVFAVTICAAFQVNAQYCPASFTNTSDDWISNVVFAGISNPSGSTVYSNFTAQSAAVTAGVSYPISVSVTTSGGTWTQYVSVWIDWNQNQIFEDATERVNLGFFSISPGAPYTFMGNIAVPANALAGTTRMRIIERWLAYAPAGACNPMGSSFGEVEDYSVVVSNTPPPPPPPTGPLGDLCANAITIACGGSSTNTTVGAGLDGPGTSCTGGSVAADVWYKIIGDGGLFTANLCTGTAYDSKLDIYTGTCGSFTSVACNDDFCGLQSSISWVTTIGTQYFIRVHGFGGATGAFTLNVACTPCPFPIPSPWTRTDIGASGGAGLQACDGSFNVSAAGVGTPTSDKGYFVHRTLSGNGFVTARINSFTNFTFGGVAFRDGTAAGARHVALFTQLGSRITRSMRSVTNGASSVALLAAPRHNWVRVARNGTVFTSYVSDNGTTWTQVNQVTVSGLPFTMNVGVFVYSQLNTLGTVNISNVSVTSGLPAPLNNDISDRNAPQLIDAAVSVFPNPASAELNIRMGEFEGEKADVKVFNLIGQVVMNHKIDAALDTERLDISKLPSGAYILQINNSTPQKFVVEK